MTATRLDTGRRSSRARGPLTHREWEVLEQAARGLSCLAAACESHHTEQTIKFHRSNIIRKLGATNTAHAVAIAYERGILGEQAWGLA